MPPVAKSTIALAVYAAPSDCAFARVVTEVEARLSRLHNATLRLTWDNEDVVILDVGATRIVLAWSEDMTDDLPCALLVSVGAHPHAADPRPDPAHEALCSRLIERIGTRYPPAAVLWQQLPLAIEADLVDALFDIRPTRTEMMPPTDPANDTPDLPRPSDLRHLRTLLHQTDDSAETPQLRLAAQAMNATLILVWAPLGAAVMTYSLLKGERIGFSARVMAVTGTIFGLSQSPVAQQMVALAGV